MTSSFLERNTRPWRLTRGLLLLAGLVGPQFLLFGPSLIADTILLPVSILARSDVYLPHSPETAAVVPADFVLSDQVLCMEYWRRFAAEEMCQGRLPLWDPHLFAGAPFAIYAKFSPFHLLYCLNPSPFMLAWLQLAKALVAGVGAYAFYRRVLQVSFGPAALGAWCWPLTGFFMLWQGYPLTCVVPWLPWLLLATDRAVRHPTGPGPIALACLTGVTVLSGQLDTALQALLASGLYGLWCLAAAYGRRLLSWQGLRTAAVVAIAWALGLLLAAVQVLPLAEYVPTGARILRRASGKEDRPPIGPSALLPVVLPDINGLLKPHSEYLEPSTSLLEGPSAAYCGLVAVLFLAPLGWCSRRHRSINLFWALLALFALGWNLNLPGLVDVLRLPGLNMLPYNRLVFVAAFAVLATAVTGLDVIWRRAVRRRWWFAVPMVLLAALAGLCAYWLAFPPHPHNLTHAYLRGLLLSLAALEGWQLVCWGWPRRGPWLALAAGVLLMAELLGFGYGLNPQCDPTLYYPRLAILEDLKQAPGRVLGIDCLPANLVPMNGLHDIRGYDGVDPLFLMQVLDLVRDPLRDDSGSYARTQWYVPRYTFEDRKLRLPGVLSMLNVRYLIFTGAAPEGVRPFRRAAGYWVAENDRALPRAFVPRQMVPSPGDEALLALLADPDFDPRQIAYVESTAPARRECTGAAEVVEEETGRVQVAVQMRTPGMVVLADLWDAGWVAQLNGVAVPVLRVNHTLRGVEVPAGASTLEFSYEPASFALGLWLTGAAVVVLMVWAALRWKLTR